MEVFLSEHGQTIQYAVIGVIIVALISIKMCIRDRYYNSGSMVGYGGGVYSCGSVDFLTSLATLLIENGLRPDQVGIGVPS